MSSPPKVSRQPSSQPLPRMGECGQRSAMSEGSMLVAYAAYSSTAHQRNEASIARGRRGGNGVRRPDREGGVRAAAGRPGRMRQREPAARENRDPGGRTGRVRGGPRGRATRRPGDHGGQRWPGRRLRADRLRAVQDPHRDVHHHVRGARRGGPGHPDRPTPAAPGRRFPGGGPGGGPGGALGRGVSGRAYAAPAGRGLARWTRPGSTRGSRRWPRPSLRTWNCGCPPRESRSSTAAVRWPARTRSSRAASGSRPGPC